MSTTTTTENTHPTAEERGFYVPEKVALFDLDAVADPTHRARLAAMIPNPALVDVYVSRELDGVNDLSTFGVAFDAEKNVLLSGPTGSAKTTAARTFAALHRLPFVSISFNAALNPDAVWGRWTLTPDKSLEWMDADALLVQRYGGVTLYDELNMGVESSVAAFHNTWDDFRTTTIIEHAGETVKSHPACFNIAAMNPGYRGTRELNEATARRFRWSFHWGYDPAVEAILIPSDSLRSFAGDVRETPEVRTDLSTDALVNFVQTAQRLGVRFAAGRLLQVFRDAERGGVRRALELHLPAIASDLGLEAPTA